jgi:hypothetical protein
VILLGAFFMGNNYRLAHAGRVCAGNSSQSSPLYLYYRGQWILALLVVHWIAYLGIIVVIVLKY